MNYGIRFLLAAFYDVGSQDIYTDAPEYQERVAVMRKLVLLAKQALEGEVTVSEVATVMEGWSWTPCEEAK